MRSMFTRSRSRSRSPFQWRRRANELIDDVRQIEATSSTGSGWGQEYSNNSYARTSTPSRFRRFSRGSSVPRPATESGIELVLDSKYNSTSGNANNNKRNNPGGGNNSVRRYRSPSPSPSPPPDPRSRRVVRDLSSFLDNLAQENSGGSSPSKGPLEVKTQSTGGTGSTSSPVPRSIRSEDSGTAKQTNGLARSRTTPMNHDVQKRKTFRDRFMKPKFAGVSQRGDSRPMNASPLPMRRGRTLSPSPISVVNPAIPKDMRTASNRRSHLIRDSFRVDDMATPEEREDWLEGHDLQRQGSRNSCLVPKILARLQEAETKVLQRGVEPERSAAVCKGSPIQVLSIQQLGRAEHLSQTSRISDLSTTGLSHASEQRSLGEDSIAQVHKALKRVEKELCVATSSGKKTSRALILKTLLAVAESLDSPDDREMMQKEITYLKQLSQAAGDFADEQGRVNKSVHDRGDVDWQSEVDSNPWHDIDDERTTPSYDQSADYTRDSEPEDSRADDETSNGSESETSEESRGTGGIFDFTAFFSSQNWRNDDDKSEAVNSNAKRTAIANEKWQLTHSPAPASGKRNALVDEDDEDDDDSSIDETAAQSEFTGPHPLHDACGRGSWNPLYDDPEPARSRTFHRVAVIEQNRSPPPQPEDEVSLGSIESSQFKKVSRVSDRRQPASSRQTKKGDDPNVTVLSDLLRSERFGKQEVSRKQKNEIAMYSVTDASSFARPRAAVTIQHPQKDPLHKGRRTEKHYIYD